MKRAILVVAVAASFVGCADPLAGLAKDTCAELDGAIVLQVGPILSKAISRAEDLGKTAPELGDAMRAECPATMTAIDNVGDEQQEREDLPTKMRIEVTACTTDEAQGTVKNDSSETVNVFIDVQFLDSSGTVIGDSIGSINGLRPGETGKWDAPNIGGESYAKCRADVSSAFAQ